MLTLTISLGSVLFFNLTLYDNLQVSDERKSSILVSDNREDIIRLSECEENGLALYCDPEFNYMLTSKQEESQFHPYQIEPLFMDADESSTSDLFQF